MLPCFQLHNVTLDYIRQAYIYYIEAAFQSGYLSDELYKAITP